MLGKSNDIFYALAMEVEHHHFYNIVLVTQVIPIQCEREQPPSECQESGAVVDHSGG